MAGIGEECLGRSEVPAPGMGKGNLCQGGGSAGRCALRGWMVWVANDYVRGFRNRSNVKIRRRTQFLRVVEFDEHGPNPGAFAAINITPAIADHPRSSTIDPKIARCIEEHAGFGFAAPVWWGISRRVAGRVADLNARELGNQPLEFCVHRLDR